MYVSVIHVLYVPPCSHVALCVKVIGVAVCVGLQYLVLWSVARLVPPWLLPGALLDPGMFILGGKAHKLSPRPRSGSRPLTVLGTSVGGAVSSSAAASRAARTGLRHVVGSV